MALKSTLMSLGVHEKMALPLFLEYPGQVPRIIQSQGATGAAQGPAHLPARSSLRSIIPACQEQLGAQHTSLATAGDRECTMSSWVMSSPQSSTSHIFQIISQLVAGFSLRHL